jgi:hypothetical protein
MPQTPWTHRYVYTSMINPKYYETARSDKFIPLQFRDKHPAPYTNRTANLSFIQPPHPHTYYPDTRSNADNRSFRKSGRKATTLRELTPAPDTPKLRETNSTKCQSPKAGSSLQQSKVAQFQRIRLLGRGKFGDVYLVKYKIADQGTAQRASLPL